MCERKCVKFKVNMYDDTKFKIIDMKPERELIHYIWTRLLTLAGKVKLEGYLSISKNIPYTIETFAIEFNRDKEQIKLALDIFIELEMLELTEDNIYRAKNFAKHQNITIKEKNKFKLNEDEIDNKEAVVKDNLENEMHDNEDKQYENTISPNKVEKATNREIGKLEIIHKDIEKIDNNMSDYNINNNSQNNIPIFLETEKK